MIFGIIYHLGKMAFQIFLYLIQKISKLKFPQDAMIGALLRKGDMLVPDGESVIQSGDSVVIVALPKSIDKIEKLFGRRRYLLPFR